MPKLPTPLFTVRKILRKNICSLFYVERWSPWRPSVSASMFAVENVAGHSMTIQEAQLTQRDRATRSVS